MRAVLSTLAATYAEAGRFAQAAETVRKALELATEQNNQPLAESIKRRPCPTKRKRPIARRNRLVKLTIRGRILRLWEST